MQTTVVVTAEKSGAFGPTFEKAIGREVADEHDAKQLVKLTARDRRLRRAFEAGPWLLLDANGRLPVCELSDDDEVLAETLVGTVLKLGLALRPDEFFVTQQLLACVHGNGKCQGMNAYVFTPALIEWVVPLDGSGQWARRTADLDGKVMSAALRFFEEMDATPSSTGSFLP